jgi:hypothetical protein
MADTNKRNILYFEGASMRELYENMDQWQEEHHKRFLTVDIQRDGDTFCCIALTNPAEVVITDVSGRYHAYVDGGTVSEPIGTLMVREHRPSR